MLADGTQVAGAGELRTDLTKNPEAFVRTFTEKLLTYALGRGVTWQDMPAIRHILKREAPTAGLPFVGSGFGYR